MKVLVVDDHALVREGLRQVLKGLGDDVEVLEAPHCAGAFAVANQHGDIDLVLLDYHLPDMNGLQALNVFGRRHPELPIIMLSGALNAQIARQVLERGAAGFLTKSALSHELLSAVRRVMAGEVLSHLGQHQSWMLDDPAPGQMEPDQEDDSPTPQLTPRQEEVLLLLLAGRTNKEISRDLELAEETTKNHVTGILRAFGVKTRVQAVLAAGRHGYAILPPSA
jgi:DNA-binding NarL/FixJ family response regulator